MDIAGCSKDPHSFAKPELARVKETHLELNVDFNRKVLEGKAILTIEREYSAQEVILDYRGLVIKSVRNFPNVKSHLEYNIKHHNEFDVFGCSFTIQLPPVDIAYKPTCQIQIEYETSRDSPALHWLKPEQTADNLKPFLLSYNKLIHARSWFPCQDTPSVKFIYTAKIFVPIDFRVLMSALLKNEPVYGEHELIYSEDSKPKVFKGKAYEFIQMRPIPSYAVIIAVGTLQKRRLIPPHASVGINIFAENKYIQESVNTFWSSTIKDMLHFAESLCGYYFWNRYDICVLPPSVAHFKIECPCVAFVSPLLLGGDRSLISYLLTQNISQSWAGLLVTCANYNNLWLNKSFSVFIHRKIAYKMLIREVVCEDEIKCLSKIAGLNEINFMIQKSRNSCSLRCLIPNLTDLLPQEATECVPYEWGCMLLDRLENILGGPSVFEPFLKSYFFHFAYKSINTKNWLDYLYRYFPEHKKKLDSIPWDFLFYDLVNSPCTPPKMTIWETICYSLAKEWIKWQEGFDKPIVIEELCDLQKILFLFELRNSYKSLTHRKMQLICYCYNFDNDNIRIRFYWLELCIKVRWAEKVESAMNFVIEFCSPEFACPIFQHLYEWTEKREKAIETYVRNREKMLCKTQNELDKILNIDSYFSRQKLT